MLPWTDPEIEGFYFSIILTPVPFSGTLEPAEHDAYETVLNELKLEGFTGDGQLLEDINRPGELAFSVLTHASDDLDAAIIFSKEFGVTVEIQRVYQDGTENSVSNSSAPRLDRPGWWRDETRVGASTSELIHTARSFPSSDSDPKGAGIVRFKESYDRQMRWRVRRGGFRPGELQETTAAIFQRVNATTDDPPAKLVERMHLLQQAGLAKGFSDVVRGPLYELADLPDDGSNSSLILVHMLTTPEESAQMLAQAAPHGERNMAYRRHLAALKDEPTSTNPVDAFAARVRNLPDREHVELLATIDKPAPAGLYRGHPPTPDT